MESRVVETPAALFESGVVGVAVVVATPPDSVFLIGNNFNTYCCRSKAVQRDGSTNDNKRNNSSNDDG